MTKIFCSIDTPDTDRAAALFKKISGLAHLKLGLEFFTAQGPQGIKKIRDLADADTELFLDLKLHDIPNTVAGAVKSALLCGADFLTIHTAGGAEMMRAAADAAQGEIKLLGVTVLTSLDESALAATGVAGSVEQQVLRLAKLGVAAGLSGFVCSPKEVALLRRELGPDILLVIPGIRPTGSAVGDQKRVMTPKEAADAGASYLVIGRPITEAPDPAQAARDILQSMAA